MEQTFGIKLRILRRKAKFTQRKLAEAVGIDFSYISKLENGRLPPPSAETTVEICHALNVDPDELLVSAGKIPPAIREAISTSPAAIQFLRDACEVKLSEDDWRQLTKNLKQGR